MALKAKYVEYISRYSTLKQEFLMMGQKYHTEENAMFLFAVIDYKRQPTLDTCYNIYQRYVKRVAEKKGAVNEDVRRHIYWVNLSDGVMNGIDAILATRNLNPNIYDGAFREIVQMLDKQRGPYGDDIVAFVKKYGLEVMAANTFTLFPQWA